MSGARGHCINGQLERGQVGDPCSHVVCPFTSERSGLRVPDIVSIYSNL